MAELPEHHHFTRWWLRRFAKGLVARSPNRVVLYDRLLLEDVGEPLRYPNELTEAVSQLRMLRQRDGETNDNIIFCDGLGDV